MASNRNKSLPIRKDIEIYRGDTWERSLRLIGRHPVTGQAYTIDTTGFTARMQVRETEDSDEVLAEAICLVGISGTGARERNLYVSFPANVTALFPRGAVWCYDLELTSPSGKPKTLFFGDCTVQGDVTK